MTAEEAPTQGAPRPAIPAPPPNAARYNDWRRIDAPPPEAFAPTRPASVIVSYFEAPRELARTLAALERQDWPRDLLEVVIVDDGSRTPLQRPRRTPLNVVVARQERRGFGLARARNAGARAAAHDILLFLDGDLLPEAGWVAAHARWHHAVGDAVTLGFYAHVGVDGIRPRHIRERAGSLEELFAGREFDPPWMERHMAATRDMTSTADDPFRAISGGNCGIGRAFFDRLGGYDESFDRWGQEDTEFAWRAYAMGGVFVPARDAFAWHQGRCAADRERKEASRERQRGRVANLIPHPSLRPHRPGRSYRVPQYVATVAAGGASAERIGAALDAALADPLHDLAARIELPPDDARMNWLREQFGADPRVCFGAAGAALEEYPAAAFHIALPATAVWPADVATRLRRALGDAAMASATLPDGAQASIIRAWAWQRSRRTARPVGDFGAAVALSAGRLGAKPWNRSAAESAWRRRARHLDAAARQLLAGARRIRTLRQAGWLLHWMIGVAARRLARFLTRRPASPRAWTAPVPGSSPSPSLPTGGAPLPDLRIACLGPRARAAFGATDQVATRPDDGHVDVALADAPDAARHVAVPVATLAAAPALAVPALDPRVDNPMQWRRHASSAVAALGALRLLPPGVAAQHVETRHATCRDARIALRWMHHVEDTQAFHRDAVARAGALARLAACGVVAKLADDAPQLKVLLGDELHRLMTADVRGADAATRERLSVRMRRAALRAHSLGARVRQVGASAALADPPAPPTVSILLVTRRPWLLRSALAAVARQTYPRLELVLGLHGDGFETAERDIAALPHPCEIARIDEQMPLGVALNAAAARASGTLLATMDDDDAYGSEHIWDLALAREYSQAQLIGKGVEFVYLARSRRTVRCFCLSGETDVTASRGSAIAGGAMLIARGDLDRLGGWRRARRDQDRMLKEDVAAAGGRIYQTHGAGFALARHGRDHNWQVDDARFLARAEQASPGWDAAMASLEGVPPPGG